MPLLDHFHPPLAGERHWESFHSYWAAAIGGFLNKRLRSSGYYAEVQVHVGRIEVDVATFDRGTEEFPADLGRGGTATLAAPAWAPPAPALSLPAAFPDEIEVQILRSEGGPTLVGAVELVSPGNKDRDDARRDFVAKIAAYLQRGIGLVVVDIVTSRSGNVHDELMDLLGRGPESAFRPDSSTYAVTYRPNRIGRRSAGTIDVWMNSLPVGGLLPSVPLALRDGPCLPLDLEATYNAALQLGGMD